MDDGDAESSGGTPGSDLPPDALALVDDADESGLYPPDSITWRVNRERVLQLNGLPGILLVYAHPKVAQSVVDYTDVSENATPLDPFRVTVEVVYDVTFADRETAIETVKRIRAIHERTTGTLAEDVGPFAAGERYDASDPELLLWVHAVLIAQALTAHETYVGALTDEQKARYYAESRTVGRLLGVPAGMYPDDLEGFYAYYDRMLDEEIAVGPQAKELGDGLLEVAGVTEPIHRIIAGGMLPEGIRAGYDLPWSHSRRRLFDGFVRLVRATLPGVPDRIRYVDEYRRVRSGR